MSQGSIPARPVAGGIPATPPPKRYRVGEVAEHFGITRQTLHNYTRWGLIDAVAHTGGGHRLYDESVFERLSWILHWKANHTIEQIGRRLANEAERDVTLDGTTARAADGTRPIRSSEATPPSRQAG